MPYPRNAISDSILTSYNVLDITQQNTTRSFRERIRGKSVYIDLAYNNISGNRFSIPYITTKFRFSRR